MVIVISFITDLKKRTILNIVTFPAVIFGLSYYCFKYGWDGLEFSVTGFIIGFLLLVIPYLLGGVGAGDVKLLSAIGTLKGAAFVVNSFFYSCLFGGLLAIVILIKRKELLKTIKTIFTFKKIRTINENNESTDAYLPFGVAIALGTVFYSIVTLIHT
jgi:prepilin peptidase CpaA